LNIGKRYVNLYSKEGVSNTEEKGQKLSSSKVKKRRKIKAVSKSIGKFLKILTLQIKYSKMNLVLEYKAYI